MVSTHLKNMSQNGNLPQIELEMKNIWNHHLVKFSGKAHKIVYNIMPSKGIILDPNPPVLQISDAQILN